MPRKKNTERKIAKFSEQQMKDAVNLVLKGGESITKAAKQCGLAKKTLSRYVNAQKAKESDSPVKMRPNYEVRQILSKEHEACLVDHITERNQLAYGLTILEFRQIVYEFAKKNKITIPNSWKTNQIAGKDWYRGFRARHPNIRLRKPEACSLNRLLAFNKDAVAVFYKNLHNILSDNVHHFADGSRIFNLDETGFTCVHKVGRVLAESSTRQLTKATSGERGALVTVCCVISGSGGTIPPAFIFPRVIFENHMLKGGPPGSLGLATSSGWMNKELFLKVMEHFIKYTSSSPSNPSLLIMDNHESHVSFAVRSLAKKNGVILLSLPPHCSNKLQPLDVSVFFSMKAAYALEADSWMLRNPGIPITIYEIAELVNKAFSRSMSISNIRNGFAATGIYPYDSNIFSDEDFIEYLVEKYKNLPTESMQITVDVSTPSSSSSASEDTPLCINSLNTTPVSAATPNTTQPRTPVSAATQPRTPVSAATQPRTPVSTAMPNTMQSRIILPREINELPDITRPKNPTTRKKRPKGQSTILTSTPEMEAKKNDEMKRAEALAKKGTGRGRNARKRLNMDATTKPKVGRKKKKVEPVESTSSESSSDDDREDFTTRKPKVSKKKIKRVEPRSPELCDDSMSSETFSDLADPNDFSALDLNDFCIVKFFTDEKRDKVKHYLGKIMENEDQAYKIKFLRRKEDSNKFYFPSIDDISWVEKQSIEEKAILTQCGTTSRQNRMYIYHADMSNFNLQ